MDVWSEVELHSDECDLLLKDRCECIKAAVIWRYKQIPLKSLEATI